MALKTVCDLCETNEETKRVSRKIGTEHDGHERNVPYHIELELCSKCKTRIDIIAAEISGEHTPGARLNFDKDQALDMLFILIEFHGGNIIPTWQ